MASSSPALQTVLVFGNLFLVSNFYSYRFCTRFIMCSPKCGTQIWVRHYLKKKKNTEWKIPPTLLFPPLKPRQGSPLFLTNFWEIYWCENWVHLGPDEGLARFNLEDYCLYLKTQRSYSASWMFSLLCIFLATLRFYLMQPHWTCLELIMQKMYKFSTKRSRAWMLRKKNLIAASTPKDHANLSQPGNRVRKTRLCRSNMNVDKLHS